MTWFLVAALVLVSAVFQSRHEVSKGVTRSGRLAFDAPVAVVFPLFTPLGEKHWAKGWDPEILYPREREVAEGMVFRTLEGESVEHLWTVTRYEPKNYVIAYNVVAPGVMVRRIEVRCRAAGANRTEVMMNDSYVGLSEEGNSVVEGLTESAYAGKMKHWQEAIGGYLAGRAK